MSTIEELDSIEGMINYGHYFKKENYDSRCSG